MRCRYPLLGASLLLLVSCGDGSTDPKDNAPPVARIVGGNQQTGVVGEALSQEIKVAVSDLAGHPLADKQILFVVKSGNGSLSSSEVVTDTAGVATAKWTLGTSAAVKQQVDARLVNTSADTVFIGSFLATPIPGPAQIAAVSGSGQTGQLGTQLPDSLVARVADRYGNPVADVPVVWNVVTGGGTLNPSVDTSDAQGYVSTRWTLGTVPDLYKATAAIDSVVPVVFLANVGGNDLSLSVVKPSANAFVGDSAVVEANVVSTYQLATVVASVGARETPLTYSSELRRWVGKLPLDSVAFGPVAIAVTATDVNHTVAVGAVMAQHDSPPLLKVVAPALYAVASPSLEVRATCADVDATGCVELTASINGQVLASGVSQINAIVSLAAYSGIVSLVVRAKDAVGQVSMISREVVVASVQHATLMATVPGIIKDVGMGGHRILYADTIGPDLLRVRTSGEDTTIFQQENTSVGIGYLTAVGSIFITGESQRPGLAPTVTEYRNGAITILGNAASTDGLFVKGNYALWGEGRSEVALVLRDLVAGTNTAVASNAGNWRYDVSLAGDVAFSSAASYQIKFVPHVGGATQVTSDTSLWNTDVLTDGTKLVYRKHDPCCTNQQYRIMLWTEASGEIVLAPQRMPQPRPEQDYQVNNGWVAYTKFGTAGELQVWSLSPANVTTQVSSFGMSSSIEALGANGAVVFKNNGQRYMATPPYGTLTPLGAAVGTVLWRDNAFFISVAGALFKVQ